MQTTYRIKAHELSMTFLKSLKTLFAGQEVEIIVKTIEPEKKTVFTGQKELLEMVKRNRLDSPIISSDIDIRALIDESQYPE